jgi:hypothetical protein
MMAARAAFVPSYLQPRHERPVNTKEKCPGIGLAKQRQKLFRPSQNETAGTRSTDCKIIDKITGKITGQATA